MDYLKLDVKSCTWIQTHQRIPWSQTYWYGVPHQRKNRSIYGPHICVSDSVFCRVGGTDFSSAHQPELSKSLAQKSPHAKNLQVTTQLWFNMHNIYGIHMILTEHQTIRLPAPTTVVWFDLSLLCSIMIGLFRFDQKAIWMLARPRAV